MRRRFGSKLAATVAAACLLCGAIQSAWGAQIDEKPRASDRLAAEKGFISTVDTGALCIGASFDDTAAFQAALDSGSPVYAPALGGSCNITKPLMVKTPGQLIYGDGRMKTKIMIQPGFSGQGVFVAQTGGPGPVWRDIGVFFVQPDTPTASALNPYPPAFFLRGTPGFQLEHMGCYSAIMCIDMKGNSGNSTISDLHFSAFKIGIDIDGSLDTVRIIDPHFFPFTLTPNQQSIFFNQGANRTIAINTGRMDDLVLRGGLFIGGVAINAYQGATGPTFGSVDGTDFDTFSGIVIAAGSLQIGTTTFTLGVADAQAIDQSGGTLTIASSNFFVGAALNKPVINMSGGALSISASQFNTLAFDATSIDQSGGGVMTLLGNRFNRAPHQSYKNATISLRGISRTIAIGNYTPDKGIGPGVFINVGNDNPFNRLIGNSSPGWPVYVPSSSKGVYLFN
jgi:hypothetical protein